LVTNVMVIMAAMSVFSKIVSMPSMADQALTERASIVENWPGLLRRNERGDRPAGFPFNDADFGWLKQFGNDEPAFGLTVEQVVIGFRTGRTASFISV